MYCLANLGCGYWRWLRRASCSLRWRFSRILSRRVSAVCRLYGRSDRKIPQWWSNCCHESGRKALWLRRLPFKSVDIGDGRRRLETEVPEGYKEVTVKAKQLYKSLDDFARNRLGVQKDKSGRYGHICNPNAVWEHYDVSTGVFILKSDAPEGDAFEIGSASKEDDYEKLGYGACEREREDSARIEDIDFDRTRAKQGIFKTTAVITPDGKWYDRGHHPEMFTDENYFKNFIEPYPHETLTLIICKI